MANDLRIKLKFDADTKELIVTQRDMNKLGNSLNTATTKAKGFTQSFSAMAKSFVAFYGIKQGFDAMINTFMSFTSTASEFENFEEVLTTLEGSSKKAKESMNWITDFAKTTPYELTQVTDAFVKMRSYGINPTDGTLRTLGDTASAMKKPLSQAVEAMADAMVGENERLKEFGLRANVMGDKVAYSWTNASGEARHTIVKNNSEVIKSTLEAIFNSKYEGAMDRQANTLSGMWLNIQDKWTIYKKSVMDNGLFNYIKALTKKISQMFEASFKDMAHAGNIGANIVIEGFKSIIMGAGHVADMVDSIKSGFLFFDSIGAFLIKAQLYIERWLTQVRNKFMEFSNIIAGTELGKLLGHNRTYSMTLINEDKFKEEIDGINSRIQNNALKIGEYTGRNLSEMFSNSLIDVNNEFKKFQNGTQDIEAPKKDFGTAGALNTEDAKDAEKAIKEKEKVLSKFHDSFIKNQLSETNYALYQLGIQYEEYEKHVKNKDELNQWYDQEYKKIMDNRSEYEKSWLDGANDAFSSYIKEAGNTYKQVNTMFAGAMKGMEDLFVDFITKGKFEFSDFINSIAADFTRMMVQKNITAPLASAASSVDWGTLFNANGNAFVQGRRVQAFATGGIVSSPTLFTHSGGLGVAGEAGNELIAPMRMGNGEMGIQSKPSKVVLNITNNTGNQITSENFSELTRTNERGELEKVISFVLTGVNKNTLGVRDVLKGMR